MSPFFQTLVSTIIGAIFGGSGVTFLTFLIQRHDKKTAGLKFIGYLVGHTHQDNIWDAENDGKQLMYCVTCAAVAQTAQWINSDQSRSVTEDAFNLVTIDTDHTLIKLVRGGGADIDNHMRTRKAICFNYLTGEKVGEIL